MASFEPLDCWVGNEAGGETEAKQRDGIYTLNSCKAGGICLNTYDGK